MKTRSMFIGFALLVTTLGLPSLALADPGSSKVHKPDHQTLIREGWKPVGHGVWQRTSDGKVETLGFGREGAAWRLADLERRFEFLQTVYDTHPSAELAEALEQHELEIERSEQELASFQPADSIGGGDSTNNCNIAYGANVDAYALTSSQGAGATASAYFHNDCGFWGDSYAYAYAQATLGTTTTTYDQRDPRSGTWVDSYATASVEGTHNCYSEAYGSASSAALNVSYSTSDYNAACPPIVTPLTVSVSGPANVYVANYNCTDATWTAAASGGTPGYSFNWYIDGYYVGSGSSYTTSYCGSNYAYVDTENVQVNASDSGGQSASASMVTYVRYRTLTPCKTCLEP